MADKDYKVQVGVEAKADTRGLDQVNKGLDKVRRTAKQVNDELDDNAAASNLEEVTDAAEGTAQHVQLAGVGLAHGRAGG